MGTEGHTVILSQKVAPGEVYSCLLPPHIAHPLPVPSPKFLHLAPPQACSFGDI